MPTKGPITQERVPRTVGATIERGNRIHRFPIAPRAVGPLLRWVATRKHPSPFLFPSKRFASQPLSTRRLQEHFKAACGRAGVTGPHVHFHTIRQTVAQRLRDAGNNVDHVAEFIGHRNSSTTGRYYVDQTYAEMLSNIKADWLRAPLSSMCTPLQHVPTEDALRPKNKTKAMLSTGRC
jgi:integrase